MADELDLLLDRVLRNDPRLELAQDSDGLWMVKDRANVGPPLMRAGRDVCERFMAAFAKTAPGSTRAAGAGGGLGMG